MSENTENLVGALIQKLETSSEVIEDLVEVFKIIDYTYDVSNRSHIYYSMFSIEEHSLH